MKLGMICVSDMEKKDLVFNSHGKKVYYEESDSEITVYDEYGDNPKNYMKPRYRLDEVGQNEEVSAPYVSIDDMGGTEEEYEEREVERNFWNDFDKPQN
jgi:hypothetical protein